MVPLPEETKAVGFSAVFEYNTVIIINREKSKTLLLISTSCSLLTAFSYFTGSGWGIA
jgi:hypothetical protein